MARYILKRKCFDNILNKNNEIEGIGLNKIKEQFVADKASGKIDASMSLGQYRTNFNDGINVSNRNLVNNAANSGNLTTSQLDLSNQVTKKESGAQFSDKFKQVRQEGYKAGVESGKGSIGITQGAKNTWNKMGTLGKATTVAAGLTAAGLIGKGLLSNNKD